MLCSSLLCLAMYHTAPIKAAYVGVMQRVSASDRWGYEALLRVYRESDLSQEKMRVLSSLTNCPDPDIVLEALDFSLSSEVRSQDAVFGLATVSKEGCDTAWKWLKDNRVTDHRLKMNFELTSFLDGDMETAVQSCAAMEQKELLEELAESVSGATG